MHHRTTVRIVTCLIALGLASNAAFGMTRHKARKSAGRSVAASSARRKGKADRVLVSAHRPSSHLARLKAGRRHVWIQTWSEPTFADSTAGDRIDGEDLMVRRAAVQALGPYNGSIVAVDAKSGRILTIVNQNLAFKGGFQPCSTIKLVAALAGLSEGVIDRDTSMRVGRRTSMNLTEALARSNNAFFAMVGSRLGFDRITRYSKQFGLGEKACANCPEEQPGTLPDSPPSEGGIGMMTTFGSGINLTPLQLASLVTAMANGGTLFHLQHPRSQEEAASLTPKIKRKLEIAHLIPEVKPGMEGAVEYGTARRASYDQNQPIFGKTGTCSDLRSPGVHLGWFGSFNEVGDKKLVVVVLLTGGRPINGPVAAGVAGSVYRGLSSEGYFGNPAVAALPIPLVTISEE